MSDPNPMRTYLINVLGFTPNQAGATLQMVEHAYRNGFHDAELMFDNDADFHRDECWEKYKTEGHKSEYGTV